MKRKGNRQWDGSDAFQGELFLNPNVSETPTWNPFPVVHRSIEGFRKVLREAKDYLGIDFEFRTLASGKQVPTIIGIANEKEAAAIKYDGELCRESIDSTHHLVGHSVLGAERAVIRDSLGVSVPLAQLEDSMRATYWANLDWSKAPDKNVDDEEQGSGGFMNLWACSSYYTLLPNWKECRGNACVGPCPVHSVFEYCAMDAWAGLHVFHGAVRDMESKGIPFSSYRDRMQTGEICQAMQDQGVRIDLPYVRMLDSRMDLVKSKLAVSGDFNVRSPKQIIAYFQNHGITFDDTDKESIHGALESLSKRQGFSLSALDNCIFGTHLFDTLGERDIDNNAFESNLSRNIVEPYAAQLAGLPDYVADLHRLYATKALGKGTAPWFHEKYLRGEFIHPRFIDTATMTTRLASAKPNFTNIPARGWGKAVKGAIIPRDPSLDIVSSDFSQLELRNCLYLAGIDPNEAGADCFTWLQQKAPDFDKAAEERQKGESGRDLAKITSHLSDYCGGVKILRSHDLDNAKVKAEIKAGALRVYLKKYGAPFDWEYGGGVVAFTGAILAENLFGNTSRDARRKALVLQEDIFYKAFPQIRRWQKDVSEYIETHGCLRSPDGRHVELYDTPEENLKKGTAWLGQGVGAAFVTAIMRRFWTEEKMVPLLVVHDDITFEVPREWSDKKVLDVMSLMEEEVSILPGFKCPKKTGRGRTWGTCKKI